MADTSRCIKEEIFGPVVVVVPFDTEDEVIARANDNPYGLAATIWTDNGPLANRVALQLHVCCYCRELTIDRILVIVCQSSKHLTHQTTAQAGTVWINCWMVRDLNMPFGGVKASGTGRESAEVYLFCDAIEVAYCGFTGLI